MYNVQNWLGNDAGKDLPGELTCRFPALIICRVHRPSAFSPQKCTLRKGQSSKLELRTSRGRSNNSVEVVPIGEVSKSRKFPRGKNLRETYFTSKNSNFAISNLHRQQTEIITHRNLLIILKKKSERNFFFNINIKKF